MKLSESTIEILKNFSSINQGLIVKKGSHLKTLSTNKNIKGEADISETFDQDFAIYDLTKTLGLLSLNKASPEVTVEKEHLSFGGPTGKIRQRFAAINQIFGYDKIDKEIDINNWDVSITLSAEAQKWILSVASILKCPHIVFRSVNGNLEMVAMDVKGQIVDDASMDVTGNSHLSGDFLAVLSIENFKLLSGTYDVHISRQGITKFVNKEKPVFYLIALEASSKF
jgi:hypothetical protein